LFLACAHVTDTEDASRHANTLLAIDGYNGTMLWEKPLTPGIMVDRNTILTTGNRLYVTGPGVCEIVDPTTGKMIDAFHRTKQVCGGTFWKWIGFLDGGDLLALVGDDEFVDPNSVWKPEGDGWAWVSGSPDTENRAVRGWGMAKAILSYDAWTKKPLWQHFEKQLIDARAICLRADRLFLFCPPYTGDPPEPGALVCLNARTGAEIWRRTSEHDRALFAAIGPLADRAGTHTTAWNSSRYLYAWDHVLCFWGPQLKSLTAVATGNGSLLWHKRHEHGFQVRVAGEKLHVKTAGQEEIRELELSTGRELCVVPKWYYRNDGRWHRFRDRLVLADRHVYRVRRNSGTDSGIRGVVAWTPLWEVGPTLDAAPGVRLETSAPGTSGSGPFPVSPRDWPVFRADHRGSCRTGASISGNVNRAWAWSAPDNVVSTAPIAAATLVFAGGTDGIVHALDAATGAERWKAYTGGPLILPPAMWKGRLYLSSGDGWIYCLSPSTGNRLWRHRTPWGTRKIPVYGRLFARSMFANVFVSGDLLHLADGWFCVKGGYANAYWTVLDAVNGKPRQPPDGENNDEDWLTPERLVADYDLYCHFTDLARFLERPDEVFCPVAADVRDAKVWQQLPDAVRTVARGKIAAFAVAPNSVVIAANGSAANPEVDRGRLSAVSLDDGKVLWQYDLPARPLRWGLCVNRDGRVIVTLQNGQVLCFSP